MALHPFVQRDRRRHHNMLVEYLDFRSGTNKLYGHCNAEQRVAIASFLLWAEAELGGKWPMEDARRAGELPLRWTK